MSPTQKRPQQFSCDESGPLRPLSFLFFKNKSAVERTLSSVDCAILVNETHFLFFIFPSPFSLVMILSLPFLHGSPHGGPGGHLQPITFIQSSKSVRLELFFKVFSSSSSYCFSLLHCDCFSFLYFFPFNQSFFNIESQSGTISCVSRILHLISCFHYAPLLLFQFGFKSGLRS